ncbi:hypothetical protein ACLKMH_00630 [Psychromonas sp. KJ10-10]|uniref:hypothetical protein n=1 Tax=Psychromonas sp. KJ10-10 TaxID=3391823 RepID=UPI0039B37D41
MKVALLTAHSRVSPVFETALTWVLIEATASKCNICAEKPFIERNEMAMAQELLNGNVEMVICGAIPYYLEKTLILQGCEVFSFLVGQVNDIVEALHLNQLDSPKFTMPGCQKRKKRENNRLCKYLNS